MNTRRFWVGALRIATAAGVFIVVASAAFVNLQQRILRWRADQLLADIRAIQMGHSSWNDAQQIMRRWGAWGKWAGSCDSQGCDYQIALQDISSAYPTYFLNRGKVEPRSPGRHYSLWQRRLYSILGGRFVQVYAGVQVKNGIVWTKQYILGTSMYPRLPRTEDDWGYMLIAQAEGVTRFPLDRDRDIVRTHPEYSVESETPCTVCKFIRAEFTPFADALIQESSLDFNIDCITRWRACDTPAQIMPAAWRIYKQQSERTQGNTISSPFKCEVPLEILGRDYRFALLTEVMTTRTFHEPGVTRYIASLSSIRSLKNEAHQKPENLRNLRLGWTDTVLAEGDRPAEIKRGDRIIFLFEAPLDEERDVVDSGIGPCSYVLDTARNRAAIEKGISHDGLSDQQ